MAASAKVAAAVGATGAAAVLSLDAYLRAQYGPDASTRLVTAYKTAIPAFAAYRWVQFRYEKGPAAARRLLGSVHPYLPGWVGVGVEDPALAAAAYEQLHPHWAPAMYDCILGLRGFYIKTGQLIANNVSDAAPPFWSKTFLPLLDKVPPKPFAQVRATVESEYGHTLEAVFESFEEEPIASASIGQVHRAVLRVGGAVPSSDAAASSLPLPRGTPRRVVVKVQYPEVEGQFRGDVSTAKTFVRVALPEHLPALNEIEKQFANEFDYRREATQLRDVRANLARATPAFDHILVPAPILPLCTRKVMVMEEVPHAEKLSEALGRDMDDFARMRGVSTEALVAEEARLNKEALARGELRCGPTAREMDRLVRLRAWRNTLLAPLIALGLASPVHVPLNHARLVDELLAVHGHEILIDGAFNGDPHAGNCLLSYPSPSKTSGSARLALVDYGQVKRLSDKQRVDFARIIVALAAVHRPGATPAEVAAAKALVVQR